jgi:hypothetical protein
VSSCKQPCGIVRIVCKAPGTPCASGPSANEGRRSAERRTSLMFTPRPIRWRADQSRRVRPLMKDARLSALHRGVYSAPGRASRRGKAPFRQRAPRSQALVPGGRCPGAARVRRATLAPRPQAPHPAPSAERLRKTPLSEQGERVYADNRIKVKRPQKALRKAGVLIL